MAGQRTARRRFRAMLVVLASTVLLWSVSCFWSVWVGFGDADRAIGLCNGAMEFRWDSARSGSLRVVQHYRAHPIRWGFELHVVNAPQQHAILGAIPMWAFVIASGAACVLSWRSVKELVHSTGGCPVCMYPRDGLDVYGPCPECGSVKRSDRVACGRSHARPSGDGAPGTEAGC